MIGLSKDESLDRVNCINSLYPIDNKYIDTFQNKIITPFKYLQQNPTQIKKLLNNVELNVDTLSITNFLILWYEKIIKHGCSIDFANNRMKKYVIHYHIFSDLLPENKHQCDAKNVAKIRYDIIFKWNESFHECKCNIDDLQNIPIKCINELYKYIQCLAYNDILFEFIIKYPIITYILHTYNNKYNIIFPNTPKNNVIQYYIFGINTTTNTSYFIFYLDLFLYLSNKSKKNIYINDLFLFNLHPFISLKLFKLKKMDIAFISPILKNITKFKHPKIISTEFKLTQNNKYKFKPTIHSFLHISNINLLFAQIPLNTIINTSTTTITPILIIFKKNQRSIEIITQNKTDLKQLNDNIRTYLIHLNINLCNFIISPAIYTTHSLNSIIKLQKQYPTIPTYVLLFL
jgi:hypothetical protein